MQYIKSIQAFEPKSCPECKCEEFEEVEGNLCCLNCGLVLKGNPPTFTNNMKVFYPYGFYI